MIASHANSGIDALHAALTSADTQLERISTRLQSELSLNHPNTKTNPFSLLHRLHHLKTDLPALREQVLSIHQQKAQLVTKCRNDLSDTTRLAKSVLPVAVPSTSDPSAVAHEITQIDNSLNALLADFRKVNAGFVDRTDVSDHQLNLALLRAVADVEVDNNVETVEGKENIGEQIVQVPEQNTVAKEPLKSAIKAKGKGRKTASGTKKTVTLKEVEKPKTKFVPVSKVVYNRLPRNLKIKAGKLPQINDFYEKVFNVLCHASDPLSDAELRNATGVNDMTKFEVLRGLAVLRHSKEGWLLAG